MLVDGIRLVNLMMDHEVGVTSRLLKLPKLDSDYFDEERILIAPWLAFAIAAAIKNNAITSQAPTLCLGGYP